MISNQDAVKEQVSTAGRKSVWGLLRDRTFHEFLSIVKKYKWYYAGAIGAQLALTIISLVFAEASRKLFDSAPVVPQGMLTLILSVFAAATLLYLVFTFINNWLQSALNETVVYEMRRNVLNQLQRLPLSFHENHHSSKSTNIMHHELEIAKNFVVFDVQKLITLPFAFIMVGVYLLTVHPALGVIAILIGPMKLLSNIMYRARFKEAVELQSAVTRSVFHTIGETLQGIREVKANQLEHVVDQRMADIQRKGVDYNVLLTKVNTLRGFAKELPSRIGYIVGIGVGAWMMANGEIGPGGLVAFITLLDKVAEPFTVMVDTISNLQRSVSGARRLFDVMSMSKENLTEGIALPDIPPSIRYEDVHFRYTDALPTLNRVSFHIPSGKTLALVGPSGAGKSTIIKLLFRFYDPQEGRILLNDTPLDRYSVSSLRERTALVSQDIFLFDGTVAENIALGKTGASRQEIERAAVLAQAYDFIATLPQGFDSEIGERGIKLSHGQKQRLSIARAILRNASILILDEPTSALDVETESSFQASLGEWASGCTKIVIAHRLTTIRDADIILFLDQGEVVEYGTREELLRLNGRFREYWDRHREIRGGLESTVM